jgi:uncharacterized protein DUF2877
MMPVMRLPAVSYHDSVVSLLGPLTVQAVFHRAWHLHASDGSVLTVTIAGEDGPLAIRVVAPLPPIAPGAPGRLAEDVLCMGQHRIALEGATRWQPPVAGERLSLSGLETDLALLQECSSPHGKPWRDRLEGCGLALTNALVWGDGRGAEDAAWSLLGLGPGLTPAGDDVLVGLLTGLIVLERRANGFGAGTVREGTALGDWIASVAPSRTTPLSATLLRWAARGVAAQPLLDVLWSLGSTSSVRGLDRLVAMGRTSGRDMLFGASLAASTFLGREGSDGLAMGGTSQRVSRLGQAHARLGGAH